jgi:predicted nucleic acid-binding protein
MSSVAPTPKPSTESKPRTPRVLVDADALVAGAFSTTGASHLVLRLGELSILECLAPIQVKVEAERNLRYKLPAALPTFQALIQHALTFTPDPSAEEVARFLTQAHPEDASILASAMLNDCQYLVTFNTRHYYPDSSTPVTILTPGKFLQQLREAISQLAQSQTNE